MNPFPFPHTKSLPSFAPLSETPGFQRVSAQNSKETPSKIEKILAKRLGKTNRPEYLIKWASETASTWEPLRNLANFQREIESFEQEWAKITVQAPQKAALSLKRYGNFAAGDVPEEILGVTMKNNVILAMIRWKIDQNGVRPLDSFVSTRVLREKAPVLLVNFYEKKIQF